MSTLTPNTKVTLSKLLWVGPLTILTSVIANLIVRALALAVFPISPEFMPLATPGPVVAFTIIGVLSAVILFALLGRFTKNPVRLFQVIAAVFLIVSFIPDLALFSAVAAFPGVTVPAVVALMSMHVVAGAITVGLLSRLTQN
jgi:hypothetical protein